MDKELIMLNKNEFLNADDEKGYELYSCNNRQELEEYLKRKDEIGKLDEKMNEIDSELSHINEKELRKMLNSICDSIRKNFKRLILAKSLMFTFSTLLILFAIFYDYSLFHIICACCVKSLELIKIGSVFGIIKKYKDNKYEIKLEESYYNDKIEEKKTLTYEYDCLMDKRNELIRELDSKYILENNDENSKIKYCYKDDNVRRNIIKGKKLVKRKEDVRK